MAGVPAASFYSSASRYERPYRPSYRPSPQTRATTRPSPQTRATTKPSPQTRATTRFSTSTSHPPIVLSSASILNAALEAYKHKTKNDLASHPLLPKLESCNSPEAILVVLREQIPASIQQQNVDDRLIKWVIPIAKVLYSFSTAVGGDLELVFSPSNIIFAGIGDLILVAQDTGSRDKLIDLFNRIELFFRRLEAYTGVTPNLAMTDIFVNIMVEVLSILATATKEASSGRLNTYFKKLIGNRDIEDGLRRLDKLTQEEAQMAMAQLLKITPRSVDSKVIDTDDRMKRVEGEIQDGNRIRDQILQWLSPSDPSSNHNITCSVRHDGTAQWFLQGSMYNQWKSSESGSFLWVRGKPGSGKSVLCSSIIQDITALRDAGRAAIAYYYFDSGDVNKQSLHDLLSSLLCQLSPRIDPPYDILSRLYSAHDRSARQPGDHAMRESLKEMLALAAQEPTYVIMDALDECPNTTGFPSPREYLLAFVVELVRLQLPNLHICVTSRVEPDIQVALEHITPHPLTLHDESGQQQDIANYVTSFVHSNVWMRKWPEADRDLAIKLLLEKADGMFSWVFCQLEVLMHALPFTIRQALEELPERLDETYERILREITEPNKWHTRLVLHCLAAADRPLRVEEIGEVLAVDFDTEGTPRLHPEWRLEDQAEAVMYSCSSLIIVVKDGDSRIVRFSHSSVKQFLTSNRLAEPIRDVSHHHVKLETAHSILAQACLGVLLQFDDRVDRDNIEGFPFAQYAAQHWAKHARVGDAYSRIRHGAECLFDADNPYFSTWLWIYNEDRGGHSMSTIRPTKPEAVPLYYAARLGIQDLVEHLIAKYSEHVNAKGGREMTPMHAAASGGHAHILRLLQENGGDVGIRNNSGETPLHGASWSGKVDTGKCLLDLGADSNARNEDDWTPLFHAVFHGHTESARMLLERGAAIEARSVFGSTALHAAVRGGEIQAVRLLLKHGADVNARDNNGWTPFKWNSTLRQEIVEILEAEYSAESGN